MTNLKISAILMMVCISAASFTVEPIPFQLAGKLIVVRATVDGQAGNFILDTGIPNLLLNARYFEGTPVEKVLHGITGEAGKLAVAYPDLEVGGNQWKKVYAEVAAMRALEDSKGIPIHGLLGTELFRDHVLLIDYQKLEILLYPLGKDGDHPVFRQWAPPSATLPFKFKGGAPLIAIQTDKTELRVTVDTGAEINLIEKKYELELGGMITEAETRAFGGFAASARQTCMKDVPAIRIGDISTGTMKTAFVELYEFNRAVQGPKADGIVGYEFLNGFRVAFNFKKQEMYLWEGEAGLMAEGR